MQDMFLEELDNITAIEERSRIGEVTVPEMVREKANRILAAHLKTNESFDQLSNAVYAMGCAVKKSLNEKVSANQPPKENRRIVKCRKQLKELRQKVYRVSNEVHRRKVSRKQTVRERNIMKKLRKQAGSQLENEHQLRMIKEKWLDQMRAKKVKLQKVTQKEKKIRNNRLFEKKEGKFYQKAGGSTEHTGTVPTIEKFTEFWGGIWEDDEKTEQQPWMEKVKQKIREKIHTVTEFKVSESDIEKVIKKRKNWTAPGIDEIENFWWKIFQVC